MIAFPEYIWHLKKSGNFFGIDPHFISSQTLPIPGSYKMSSSMSDRYDTVLEKKSLHKQKKQKWERKKKHGSSSKSSMAKAAWSSNYWAFTGKRK